MLVHPKLAVWIIIAVGILVACTFFAFVEWVKADKENKHLRTSLNTYKRVQELYEARERTAIEIAKKVAAVKSNKRFVLTVDTETKSTDSAV